MASPTHELAELDRYASARIAALQPRRKLTAADLDAADARRNAPLPAMPARRRGRIARWAARIAGEARSACIRWDLSSCEQWVAACHREGIADTDTLREWERHVQHLRVRLAVALREVRS